MLSYTREEAAMNIRGSWVAFCSVVALSCDEFPPIE